jgi:hypothetical protein
LRSQKPYIYLIIKNEKELDLEEEEFEKTIGIIGKLIPEENIFERFNDCKSFVISKQAKIKA